MFFTYRHCLLLLLNISFGYFEITFAGIAYFFDYSVTYENILGWVTVLNSVGLDVRVGTVVFFVGADDVL